jgi:hypothetical protein
MAFTRRAFLGGALAAGVPRHRRHVTAARAVTAGGEGAVMPVTILNTGTFNGGGTDSPAAGPAAASAAAKQNAATAGAAARLAAASAAGAAISRLGPGLVGDQATTDQYGTGTQASAITAWQTATGRTMQVRRVYYSGAPPSSIDANLSADAAAGRAAAISFKPTQATTLGGGSSTDRTTIDSFLSSCVSAGLKAAVCMYHEPVTEIGNASTYAFTQQYYGPTVRTYYPLVYGGQCGDFAHGSLANYQSYYNTAVTAGAAFDTAMVDYYCTATWTLGSSTLLDGHAAFTDGQGLASFGNWEYGVDEDVVSTTVGTNWWNYMASFYAARAAAGKGIGYLTHFSLLTPDGVAGHPFNNAAATYEISLFDALWDAVG